MASRRQESRSRSNEILDAAERLFTRFGYRRTVMDDVAQEAGVAKGTLYLYFTNKEALFRAIQARTLELGRELCAAAEAQGGSLADRLFGYLDGWFGMMHERYGESEYLFELSSARSSVSADIARAGDEDYTARLAALLRAADCDGIADLASLGLEADAIARAMIAAARGAKYAGGQPVRLEAYRASLRATAAIFAAALSRHTRHKVSAEQIEGSETHEQ